MEYKHLKNIVVYETTKRKKSAHVNKINLCRILEFNRRMNSMEYILPINGKIIVEIKMQDYDNYKTLTRNEFIKYNGCVCFDYVMYEDWYFTTKFSNIPHRTFYCDFTDVDGDHPSHSFLLFYIDNDVYWFESSWKIMRGVYKFSSENMALSYIIDVLKKNAEEKIVDEFICEYNASSQNLIHVSIEDYRDYMLKQTPKQYRRIKKPNYENKLKLTDLIDNMNKG